MSSVEPVGDVTGSDVTGEATGLRQERLSAPAVRDDRDVLDLPGLDTGWPATLRGAGLLAGFIALTLPLLPVQAVLKRVSRRAARRLPNWYHRRVCRLIGIRLHIEGAVVRDRPVLIVANHSSWLDIPVLSALAPVSFVAKTEVGRWPGVGMLARLQRTVFVDRARRAQVGVTAGEISRRLGQGDAVVLFAEGTSTDGNRVLTFKTSLFAAVLPGARSGVEGAVPPDAVVQTVTLAYTHLHGLPLGRADRPLIGWYGDMEMADHAWALLKAGPIDVSVRVGRAMPLAEFADRKALARYAEGEVRASVVELLREGGHGSDRRRVNSAGSRQEDQA